MNKPIKHLPKTWEKIFDVKVMDPDGWRRDGCSWNKPLTEEEWKSRQGESTCKHNKWPPTPPNITPHPEEGKVEEVHFTRGDVRIKTITAAVDGNELTIDVSPTLQPGRVHFHFSGLGSKRVRAEQSSANGVDIIVEG